MFLLNLLKGGRLSAGEICEHFSVTGASISRHLAILKDADLIRSKNSEFVALLKQANTDISKISEDCYRFVTNSQSGMGLLKCGNVVIPFDNQIERIRVFINCITPISMRKLKIKKVDDKTMVICKFRLIGRNIHCSLRSQ